VEIHLGQFDKFILLASLTIFFIGGAYALVDIRFSNDGPVPTSVMVSPTAAEMIVEDPRPKTGKIIKLCYSPEKFIEEIRHDGVDSSQKLLARGVNDRGQPIEIYASNTLGYGGTYAVYVWERNPGMDPEICRIMHGKNLELISADNPALLKPDYIPAEVEAEEKLPAADGDAPEFLENIGQTHELKPVDAP
jgi:hypothetical protein